MNFVEKEPKVDRRCVQRGWDCEGYEVCPWEYANFYKTMNMQIRMNFFKRFPIYRIVYILQ